MSAPIQRWDESSSDFFDAVDSIFEQVLELPADQRHTFLDEACGNDTALKASVLDLLNAVDESHPALQGSAQTVFATLASDLAQQPTINESLIGQIMGPYRLLRELGQGGMGTVFLAERADGQFQQQVALKVVRTGLLGSDVLNRFRQERQILARLEHPNIARLYDGGITETGLPYLVMEYVEGVPITTYCDLNRLTTNARLKLFQRVCTAVQYAHQNLIVHRDLKPSNILVTESGEVKLLDFGIAKLVDDDNTGDQAITMTRTGIRLMTPEYAAPEQIQGDTVTTASDVYALGVLLYELLTGHRPYRLEGRLQHEIARVILEEEPTHLSTVIGEAVTFVQQGETRTLTPAAISAARGTTTSGLRRQLRGDLDRIVLQALRKEAARRYSTVSGLMDDVRSYLSGLPVSAQPDSMGYRLRKFVRRNRVSVGFASVLTATTLVFVVALVVQQAETASERDRAQAEATKAEEVTDFLVGLFDAADPAQSKGADITARELLARGEQRIADELAEQPEIQATMRFAIADVYYHLGEYDSAVKLNQEALEQRRQLFGDEHASVSETLNNLGLVLWAQSKYAEAEVAHREALAINQVVFKAPHTELAKSIHNLAATQQSQGHLAEAESLYVASIAMERALSDEDTPELASSLGALGLLLRQRGAYAEAEAYYRDGLAMNERLYGEDHPEITTALYNLGRVLEVQGRYAEAEPIARRVLELDRIQLGPDHPYVAYSLSGLGTVLFRQRKYEEARPYYEEALALNRRVLGKAHSQTAAKTQDLANLLAEMGQLEQAVPLFEDALQTYRTLHGDAHANIATVLQNLGNTLAQLQRYAEGETHLLASLSMRRELLGNPHADNGITLRMLGDLQRSQKRVENAVASYQEALTIFREAFPNGHHRTASVALQIGQIYQRQANCADAEPLFREAYTIRQAKLGADNFQTVSAQNHLGQCLLDIGQYDEAEPLLRESYQAVRALHSDTAQTTQDAKAALMRWYTTQSQPVPADLQD